VHSARDSSLLKLDITAKLNQVNGKGVVIKHSSVIRWLNLQKKPEALVQPFCLHSFLLHQLFFHSLLSKVSLLGEDGGKRKQIFPSLLHLKQKESSTKKYA
jgi:hypothetical protein